MKVLGIDPGLARIGFGIVECHGSLLKVIDYGLLTTSSHRDLPHRLQEIYDQIQNLLHDHVPDWIATEQLVFAQNKTTAIAVSQALGVILLAAAESGIGWSQYSPPEVKSCITGNGSADKRQVTFMVTRLLALDTPPKPDDVADALAIAICHASHSRIPPL